MGGRGEGGMEVGQEGQYIPIATLSPPEQNNKVEKHSTVAHIRLLLPPDEESI